MKQFPPRGFAALLAGLTIAGCRTTPPEARPEPQTATVTHPDSAAVARAVADSARLPYTEADVHFMSAMISHHAQAIHMARMAANHDASPEVQRLADRIINAQQDEIATMQRWLRERRQPVPEPSIHGHRMQMNGEEHVMLMPGMLTKEQLEALDQGRGADFDWLFITSMIQHHRGAVEMVKQLFSSWGAGQDETVFKFASDVNVDQTTEINRMVRLLASLPSQTRSP